MSLSSNLHMMQAHWPKRFRSICNTYNFHEYALLLKKPSLNHPPKGIRWIIISTNLYFSGKTFWMAATMRAFHFSRNHLFRCQAEIINLIYLNKLLYSEGHRMQLTVHWSHWGREHRYYWTPLESRSFDNTSHFTSSLTILFVMLLIFKLLLQYSIKWLDTVATYSLGMSSISISILIYLY